MSMRHADAQRHSRISVIFLLITALVLGTTSFPSLAIAAPVVQDETAAGEIDRPTVRFTQGHTDVLTVVPNGPGVSLVAREDVSEPGRRTFHNPARIVFEVAAATYTDATQEVPGVETAGYALPQTEDPNFIWPGFESNMIATLNPSETRFIAENLEGTGKVFLWGTGGFGRAESILGENRYELTPGATITHKEPAHQHANWLFTEAGTYKLTFRVEVDTPNGTLVSDPATYTFDVVNRDVNSGERSDDQSEGTSTSEADDDSTDVTESESLKPSEEESATAWDRTTQEPGNIAITGADGSNAPSSTVDSGEVCIPTPVSMDVPVLKTVKGTAGGTKTGGSYTIPANTHVHPNWVFTKPGTYKVSMTQTAKMKSGKTVSTNGILTFIVGGSGNANSGHFDIGTIASPQGIQVAVKDDRRQPPTWGSPSTFTFGLGSHAKVKAPAGIEFIAQPGQDIWMVSSAQVEGVPWVGANTMHPDLLKNTTGAVTWQLNSVSGPGSLAVFESGNFGKIVGRMWFGGASAGTPSSTATEMTTRTQYVGKTASGQDCVLDADTVAELREQGHEVAASSVPSVLSHTGSNVVTLGIAAMLLFASGLPLVLRRRVQ